MARDGGLGPSGGGGSEGGRAIPGCLTRQLYCDSAGALCTAGITQGTAYGFGVDGVVCASSRLVGGSNVSEVSMGRLLDFSYAVEMVWGRLAMPLASGGCLPPL